MTSFLNFSHASGETRVRAQAVEIVFQQPAWEGTEAKLVRDTDAQDRFDTRPARNDGVGRMSGGGASACRAADHDEFVGAARRILDVVGSHLRRPCDSQ